MDTSIDTIAERLGPLARRDHPLGVLTTYGVGGTAAVFVHATCEEDLLAVREALRSSTVPVLVLGRGSNMLVSDRGFLGVVVRLGDGLDFVDPGISVVGGPIAVRAGGATALPALARRTVEAGLSGLEWAVGVPGSVGGALRMNAGGHGSDVAASLLRYRWLDLRSQAGGVGAAGDLALGYRQSALTDSQVVVWAEFALSRGERATGRELLAEIVRWRRANQPGGSNAGSVFVNPEGDSAGRLVEQAGLKGLRLGSATVSPKHANFIQADRGGSANDVLRLMEHVRNEVHRKFGVRLRTEVRLVGFE